MCVCLCSMWCGLGQERVRPTACNLFGQLSTQFRSDRFGACTRAHFTDQQLAISARISRALTLSEPERSRPYVRKHRSSQNITDTHTLTYTRTHTYARARAEHRTSIARSISCCGCLWYSDRLGAVSCVGDCDSAITYASSSGIPELV